MDREEFYNQVKIGDGIPSLVKKAVLEGYQTPEIFGNIELATEAEKAKEKAEALGVNTVHTSKIFPGVIMLQFISEMITNWLPDLKGWVQGGGLSAKFIGLVKFNETITCKGKIKDKIVKDKSKYLICDVWIENISGDKVLVGEAHIVITKQKCQK